MHTHVHVRMSVCMCKCECEQKCSLGLLSEKQLCEMALGTKCQDRIKGLSGERQLATYGEILDLWIKDIFL